MPPTVLPLVGGVAKVFVGEMVEMGMHCASLFVWLIDRNTVGQLVKSKKPAETRAHSHQSTSVRRIDCIIKKQVGLALLLPYAVNATSHVRPLHDALSRFISIL